MAFHLAIPLFPLKDTMKNSLEANIMRAINRAEVFISISYNIAVETSIKQKMRIWKLVTEFLFCHCLNLLFFRFQVQKQHNEFLCTFDIS